MARFFNTAGPCDPARHYMLPAERRIPEVRGLIAEQHYFVIRAPRQVGKTTTFRTLAAELTTEGSFAPVHATCETGQAAGSDVEVAVRTVTAAIEGDARIQLEERLRPPPFSMLEGKPARSMLNRWRHPGGLQRVALELKVWRARAPDPVAKGKDQLAAYLDRLGLESGCLVVFDRRPDGPPFAERGQRDDLDHAGKQITALRRPRA